MQEQKIPWYVYLWFRVIPVEELAEGDWFFNLPDRPACKVAIISAGEIYYHTSSSTGMPRVQWPEVYVWRFPRVAKTLWLMKRKLSR